jgi:type I restriction enzyme S subunit
MKADIGENKPAMATLGDVTAIAAGAGFPKNLQGRTSGEIPFFKVGDISEAWLTGSKYLVRAKHYISKAEAQQIGARILPAGSVVMAKIGEAIRLNRRAVLLQPSLVDNNVMALIPRDDLLGSDFLYYYSQTLRLGEMSQATTVPSVRKSDVEKIRIPLPARATQQVIVEEIEKQFSRLDAAVESLRRARANLTRYRASVLHRAVGGGEGLGSWGSSEPWLLPTGWGWQPFGSLLREPLRNGHSSKRAAAGEIPIFTLTAVTKGDFSGANIKFTSADPKRVHDLWAQPGDIFIERSNTPELVGTSRLYRGPANLAVFPDLLIRARVSNDVRPEFAEIVLNGPYARRYFQRRAEGIAGSMPKIDQGDIQDFSLPLAPMEEQDNIIERVARQISVIEKIETEVFEGLKRGERLRQSILSHAFSGRLILNHAKVSGGVSR